MKKINDYIKKYILYIVIAMLIVVIISIVLVIIGGRGKSIKTELVIEDRCDITIQSLETFYSDEKYDYQFSSDKSECTYAIINNEEYLIKDALNKGLITIEEAERAGLEFYKSEK